MIVEHATSDVNLSNIRARGLIPQGSSGADLWASSYRPDIAVKSALIRKPSVYVLRNDPKLLRWFGSCACTLNGGKPVGLTLDIPPILWKNFLPDECFAEEDDARYFRYEGVIPPEYIVDVQPLPPIKVSPTSLLMLQFLE